MPTTQPQIPTKTEIERYQFPGENSRPKRTRSLTQLIDAAETIYSTLMDQPLLPTERAALARALCDVDKRIRAWKGLPDPSPFCPDGVPMKRLKVRRGKVIEAPSATTDAPIAKSSQRQETTTATPTPTTGDEAK